MKHLNLIEFFNPTIFHPNFLYDKTDRRVSVHPLDRYWDATSAASVHEVVQVALRTETPRERWLQGARYPSRPGAVEEVAALAPRGVVVKVRRPVVLLGGLQRAHDVLVEGRRLAPRSGECGEVQWLRFRFVFLGSQSIAAEMPACRCIRLWLRCLCRLVLAGMAVPVEQRSTEIFRLRCGLCKIC